MTADAIVRSINSALNNLASHEQKVIDYTYERERAQKELDRVSCILKDYEKYARNNRDEIKKLKLQLHPLLEEEFSQHELVVAREEKT